MDTLRLDDASPKNLENIQKVLEIATDAVYLNGGNRLELIKIPVNRFSKDGIDREEFIGILKKVNTGDNVFEFPDEAYRWELSVYEQNPIKEPTLKPQLPFGLSKRDLDESVILRIIKSYTLEKLNEILAEVKKYTSQKIVFPLGEKVVYQNQVLFFKLGDGTFDSIDFNSAPELRKVFECFWELKKRKSQTNFKPQDVINIYEELFKKDIDRRHLASQISNIRTTKIKPKSRLKDRFKIYFDRDSQTWIFILS